MRALIGLAVGLFAIVVEGQVSASVPNVFTVQGILRDGTGQLQSTGVKLVVTLFDARNVGSGSTIAGPWGPTDVMAEDGLFSVTIDEPMLRSLLATVPQLWLELTVDGEALPRQRVTADIYAVLAGGAEQADRLSSACSSCVEDAMIKAVAGSKVTGKVDSAAMADTVANGIYSSGMYVDPAWLTSLSGSKIQGPVPTSLSAVDFTGVLSGDVTGTQAATSVMKIGGSPLGALGMAKNGDLLGFNGMVWAPVKSYGDMDVLLLLQGAGFLKKGDPIGVNQLPGDGIDKVSNGLVTATVDSTFADPNLPYNNDPLTGIIQSPVTVPDIGAVKGITVAINISDADIKGLLIELFAPDGSSVTFYDRSSPGVKDFVKSFDHATMGLPKGNLATYLGKHPTGTWSLKVTTNVVGDKDVLNSWSLRLVALSGTTLKVAGDLQVSGNTATATLNGAAIGQLTGARTGQAITWSGSAWVPGGRFGGTGADGPLSLVQPTNIDLKGASVFVRNYTSMSITGAGSLSFSNPAATGTTVILKSKGDVVLTSAAPALIDLRNMGGDTQQIGTSLGLSSRAGTTGANRFASRFLAPGGASPLYSPTIEGKFVPAGAGAGGGNGGAYDGEPIGIGGRGAGGLYIECGGALTFSGTIVADGTAGGPSVKGTGAGGGGGGGSIVVLYSSLAFKQRSGLCFGRRGGCRQWSKSEQRHRWQRRGWWSGPGWRRWHRPRADYERGRQRRPWRAWSSGGGAQYCFLIQCHHFGSLWNEFTARLSLQRCPMTTTRGPVASGWRRRGRRSDSSSRARSQPRTCPGRRPSGW